MGENPDLANAQVVYYVTKIFTARCKIPSEWSHMIQEIVSQNISAIAHGVGNLELVYRRTLGHAEELRELDKLIVGGSSD